MVWIFSPLIGRVAIWGRDATQEVVAGGAGSRGLRSWDARIKLPLLFSAVGLNMVVAQLWLSLALFLISLSLAIWSRVRWRWFALFFLAPAWATMAVFAGFSVGFGRTPVWDPGPFTVYREGLLQGASAASRVACDMSWMALVFLTTPFPRVLAALRWYRVPGILLDTLATGLPLYLFGSRGIQPHAHGGPFPGGFDGYWRSFKILGMILARIILRAYDRSKAIQAAMTGRGDEGHSDSQTQIKPDFEVCPNLAISAPICS
jgi:energy-coupling factor transporter transmembrane protein EcfT